MTKYNSIFEKIFSFDSSSLFGLFMDRLTIYLFIYTVTILIGLCIIGFPIINFMPLAIGFVLGLKLCYYYNLYKFKGISFSILMIVPETSFMLVVIIYTLNEARKLSKTIMEKTLDKNNSKLNRAGYLKNFLYYLFLIIVISAVNSLLIYLFSFIVKI